MGKISRLAAQRLNKTQAHGAKRKSGTTIKDDWNTVTIPDGFQLVIDTREQQPLFSVSRYKTLSKYSYIPIIRNDIPIGDYTIYGMEELVTIERKKQSDFESYISSEYKHKTIHKLNKLSKCYFAGLIIEANEYDLYEFPISPAMTKEKIRNQLASINAHYNIHTYINEDRQMLEMWVLDRLVRMYNYIRNYDIKKKQHVIMECDNNDT